MFRCRPGSLFTGVFRDVASRKTSPSLIYSSTSFKPYAASEPVFPLPLMVRRYRGDSHLDIRQRENNAHPKSLYQREQDSQREIDALYKRKQKARQRLAEEEDKKRSLGSAYRALSDDAILKLQQTAQDGKWRGRIHDTESDEPKKEEPWKAQKAALSRKFTSGWNPIKKLSPDAIDGIRALHKQQPLTFTTEVLANEFEVSAEAIRRILKSKWKPDEKTALERKERWEKRGNRIWGTKAEQGVKPPKKWRVALGIKLMPKDGTGRRVGLGPGSVPGFSSTTSMPPKSDVKT